MCHNLIIKWDFYRDWYMCPGDAAQLRVEAERQCAQAAQEQSKLEEKLAQVERNALLTLNNKEHIHREKLEAERRQKVL